MTSSQPTKSDPPSDDLEDTQRTSICEEPSAPDGGPVSHAEIRTDPLVGERIGPYQVLERIGAGGMATVYLARDSRQAGIHQYIAMKTVHPHFASDPSFVAMFVDEARIASLLRHPNVCRVMDYGQAAGKRFLVMEHLCGVSLAMVRRVIARRMNQTAARPALPIARRRDDARRAALVARMIEDACEGLHAVHELKQAGGEMLNVVHRDISPENLMLTCHGVVKLVDFGIVKTDFQRHTTQEGIVKGKLAYLPPEALQGQPIDRRADVWGIGVTAWELLTGKRLFRRESDAQTILAVAKSEVPPPSQVCPTLSPLYDEPILKALAADPADRYHDARSFGRALREVSKRLGRGADAGDLEDWLREEIGHGAVCRELWAVETTKQNAMAEVTPEPPPLPPPVPVSPAFSIPASSPPPQSTAPRRRSSFAIVAALATLAGAAAANIAWASAPRAARQPERLVASPAVQQLAPAAPAASASPPSGTLVLELWDAERRTMIWRSPVPAASGAPAALPSAPAKPMPWPPVRQPPPGG
jgi:eukaryotic-like serine/threonine-protein kinase